ncbi:MAG: hypothetical protein R3277_06285 [Brumimicrobium sp.]|nr:hypothetical protein [Brumimicrobium sp.]
MLFNTSHKDKNIKKEISELVGSYGTFNGLWLTAKGRLRWKDIEISGYSKLFAGIMSRRNTAVKSVVKMMPRGILIEMNIRGSKFTWAVPYQYLSINEDDDLILSGKGEFLKLKVNSKYRKQLIRSVLLKTDITAENRTVA